MNNASSLIAYGSYVSDGAARTIEIQPGFDRIVVMNRTDWGDTTAVTNVRSEWQRGMPDASAFGWTQAVTTNALASEAVSSGGFTPIDSYADLGTGAALSITAITNAAPPVASISSTANLYENAIVRISDSATAKQLNGYDFTVDNIVTNTSFDLTYMVAPGSVGGATDGLIIPFDLNWYPRRRLIADVTTGSTTQVAMTVTCGYVVDQIVRFKVPSAYGMTQLDGLQGKILSINTTTNTITVDIDSTGFTAFAFPSSAAAALGVTPAQVIPVGEYATTLDAASRNAGFSGINLGASVVGPSSATMDWWAFKADVTI